MSEIIVKPLEWTQSGDDFIAASVVGEYEILQTPQAWTAFRNGQGLSRHNDNPEAAKAAAQSDYEARIRSALSVPLPEIEGGDKGDGWQIAEDEIVDALLAKEPFVFDPATHFIHADDGGAPEHGIKYVPADLYEAWMPIDTAPKDGTSIDLWGVNHLTWDKRGERIINVKWGAVSDWIGRERDDWQHGRGEDFEPTHWMPLPAAPSASIEGETHV